MEGLHFTFPNPEHQDLEDYTVPELMAYMAVCYYRYFADPEFVRQQLAWCEKHLGRDIQDRLASSDDDNNGDYGNGYGNGDYDNGYDDESTWH
jgi:hypothetical protein